MNGGWLTDYEPGLIASFYQIVAYGSRLYQSRLNQNCTSANANNETRCFFPYYSWNYIPNRLFSAQSVIDVAMLAYTGFIDAALITLPIGQNYVQQVGESIHGALLTNFKRTDRPLRDGVFLSTCWLHVLDWTGLTINNRTLASSLTNWYYGTTDDKRVTYDECDIRSVIELTAADQSLYLDCPRLMAKCTKVTENPFTRAVNEAQNSPVDRPSGAPSKEPETEPAGTRPQQVNSSESVFVSIFLIVVTILVSWQ